MLLRWNMVPFLCFEMTMNPNIQPSSRENSFKIEKMRFFSGLSNLKTSTPLRVCENCWRSMFTSRTQVISNNWRILAHKISTKYLKMYAKKTFATIGTVWKLQNKLEDTKLNIKLFYPILLLGLTLCFVEKKFL